MEERESDKCASIPTNMVEELMKRDSAKPQKSLMKSKSIISMNKKVRFKVLSRLLP